jgi:hypothetical protein
MKNLEDQLDNIDEEDLEQVCAAEANQMEEDDDLAFNQED